MLHVHERDVDQRLHRLERISRRLRHRAAERRAQILRGPDLDRGAFAVLLEVLDDAVNDPVAEAPHLVGLESERVGR